MNKTLLILFLFPLMLSAQQQISREGNVTFFSYTPVENIKAVNNQVASIIDLNSSEIAISILMRAFVFEKALMQEHFNESYMESDLYPEATFEGFIQDFDLSKLNQVCIIEGNFTLKGITKQMRIKTEIKKTKSNYTLGGKLEVSIKDFNIKVPELLAKNIAETIQVTFNLDYEPNEE